MRSAKQGDSPLPAPAASRRLPQLIVAGRRVLFGSRCGTRMWPESRRSVNSTDTTAVEAVIEAAVLLHQRVHRRMAAVIVLAAVMR